jgi:hypothetical protein
MRVFRPKGHRRVSFLACREGARDHELATHRAMAARLASLLDCEFLPDGRAARPGELGYVVPNDTLVCADAQRLGIADADDLFGGVVPWPYVATKTITHPLIDDPEVAPEGWRPEFARRVQDVVMPGFSVFCAEDARRAANDLLREGPIRLKLAGGIGGLGQTVVSRSSQLEEGLAQFDTASVRQGLVLERDLSTVRTFSVGRVRVGTLEASYFGEQRTTRNGAGAEVYGGSTLTLVRGGFDALEQATGDRDLRAAIACARVYHDAAVDCFAGMFASRCNYDVAHGRDANGQEFMGVLEQSWRIGGASGAEIEALHAFASDPSLHVVRASTVEEHGMNVPVPDGATLYFQGTDPHVGPITKYALLHDDAVSRRDDRAAGR